MTHQRQVTLGIFFIVTLSILGIYTLFLSDFSPFEEEHFVRVHFPEAMGLRAGDPVLVAGLRTGRVTDLSYAVRPESDEQRITVEVSLDRQLFLFEDYSIQIAEATFLGGRQIEIAPGTSASPEHPWNRDRARPIQGTIAANPLASLQAVGELIQRNEQRIDSIFEEIELLVRETRTGPGVFARLISDGEFASEVARGVGAFADTAENASVITGDLRAGKGTLGRLLVEQELYDGALAFIADLQVVSTDLRSTDGVFGRLVRDTELADEVDRMIRNATAITDRVQAGEGTVGRLVYNDTVAVNLEMFTGSLAAGEGTLGALTTDRELYDNLSALSGDLRVAASAIRNGDGTLGQLIMERELYDGVLTSVRLLNRSLEDYREAAPISTLTSVFFGAF